jgi:subtilisin family serine protease
MWSVRHFYPGTDLTLGQGVTVGVVDSGVATNHPGLVVQGGQNTVPGEKPGDYGDNGTEGHGTHVAGIIASRGTPPKGIRGVAPGATLRSYRVFPKGGNQASNYAIAKAIDAGVADGCDLLNMSLGGGNPDTLTEEALTAAHDAGVVVFAANGNDDRKPVSFPAAFSMCQAVSAMGRKGTFPKGTEPNGSIASPYGKDKRNFVATFSNIGAETDLTGPGVGVISTVPAGFGVMSGTSMATPAETGAAARLLATHKNILGMPRDQNRAAAMISALAAACKRLGFGAIYEGKGMIGV